MPSPFPPHALAPCPPERAFRFLDGAVARSLEEFAQRLDEESPSVVAYHKDHFAPWLRGVVGDAPLARRVEAVAAQGAEPSALRDVLRGLARTRVDELRRARP